METAEKLDLTDELLPIYGNVVDRLQHSDSKEFLQPVDHAFIQRAEILLEENHDQEAARCPYSSNSTL
ncbi:MAG: hypothetical protein U5K69_25640 [Balneolaceae bacterium]|nr:hypothetical protein [Balneolaceae bacterium]